MSPFDNKLIIIGIWLDFGHCKILAAHNYIKCLFLIEVLVG